MSTPIELNLVGNLTLDELLRHVEEDEFEVSFTPDDKDDNIPLKILQLAQKKSTKRNYNWSNTDLQREI
ncbi:hypothetical protein QE152_g21619 [Popillia japonica]|uniref:Uncharacterized protein n=1 Tax=Popillia japonica TaxID=7064 RepID=A0AAW1KLE0_POPJA